MNLFNKLLALLGLATKKELKSARDWHFQNREWLFSEIEKREAYIKELEEAINTYCHHKNFCQKATLESCQCGLTNIHHKALSRKE